MPHLLRELVFFEERCGSQWTIYFKELLYEVIKLKRNLTSIQYLNPIFQRNLIMEQLSVLLLTSGSENRKDLYALCKRINI